MIERTPWFQRSFDAGPPASMLPNLVERLRGTPLRLSDRLLGLAPDMLTRRHDGSWSIQENVGHLWDLEELWASRLDDFLSSKETLTPADLENQKTHIANHNDRDLYGLVAGFRLARAELIAGLEQLTGRSLACATSSPSTMTTMSRGSAS
ncbi:MAG: DinB family protein [Planctomycetota bacterium]|jgi:hypothetical protein